MSHYAGVERNLLAGNPEQAVQIIQSAKEAYGKKDRLLYLLDHGMVLHLAARYSESNEILEEAYLLVEDLYTKRLRDEATALLVNEARKPYEGTPHEHVMIHVVKALNFAMLQQWNDALVEGRRIDHRLNVLVDKQEGTEAYQEDPFARYLVGLLYDMTGDLNNAYVGYRKAEQVYEDSRAWSRVVLPDTLKADLIRTAQRLGLKQEAQEYREKYPEVAVSLNFERFDSDASKAQLIVLSYHGQGPRKEDLVIDVPVSLDALQLVALTKPGFGRSTRSTRGGEALLYGIHGRIARIALPRFTMQKPSLSYDLVHLKAQEIEMTVPSQRVYDIAAVAEKNLADEYDGIVLRAVARTAMKMSAAEGIGLGARAVSGRNNRDWIGPLVGGIARIFALATEEADIRTWRTLPGEIQLTRLWVNPGEYSVSIRSIDAQGHEAGESQHTQLRLVNGETRMMIHQSLQ
ncbi:MAG: COG3014 family protein [Nitrospirales bacterium]